MTHFEDPDDGRLYGEVDELIDDGPVDLARLDSPEAVYRTIARHRSSDWRTKTQDAEIGAIGSSLLGESIDPEKIKP